MVGTQYQAEVPSCLSHYRDGEKGTFSQPPHLPETSIFFLVNMKRFIPGIGLDCSTYVVFQLMRMKMSCYGAQVLFQKAGFEVSCWTCSLGRRMRSRDMRNQESTFATMSRSVMSAIASFVAQ